MLIINSNVGTKEEFDQTSQQHTKKTPKNKNEAYEFTTALRLDQTENQINTPHRLKDRKY